jgi:hypothetical protein
VYIGSTAGCASRNLVGADVSLVDSIFIESKHIE